MAEERLESAEAAENKGWEGINESRGLRKDPRFESGTVLNYRGYIVNLVDGPRINVDGARIFAWAEVDQRIVPDPRTGRGVFFNLVESIPKKFWVPILEHEVCEHREIVEQDRSRKAAHQEAKEVGRKVAEELGILDEFLRFEEECNKN